MKSMVEIDCGVDVNQIIMNSGSLLAAGGIVGAKVGISKPTTQTGKTLKIMSRNEYITDKNAFIENDVVEEITSTTSVYITVQ